MSHSKYNHTSSDSDESLNRMKLSLGSCQGYNWDAIMLQEALATTTQPREKQKSRSDKIIGLGTVLSWILLGLVLLVGFSTQADIVDTPTDTHHAAQHQDRL